MNAPLLFKYKPDLTVAQRNFLELHMLHLVERWQWHFLGTQLRAHAGIRSATIWRDDLNRLIERGLIQNSHGFSHRITQAGIDKLIAP